MGENDLTELKEWLRIDSTDDDVTLVSLINTSQLLIKQSTNVDLIDVQSVPSALELYKTLQKMIITDLYENRDGSSKLSPVIISMYAQLEAYKLGDV
jgi:hypothetical protein